MLTFCKQADICCRIWGLLWHYDTEFAESSPCEWLWNLSGHGIRGSYTN